MEKMSLKLEQQEHKALRVVEEQDEEVNEDEEKPMLSKQLPEEQFPFL